MSYKMPSSSSPILGVHDNGQTIIVCTTCFASGCVRPGMTTDETISESVVLADIKMNREQAYKLYVQLKQEFSTEESKL